MTGKPTCSPGLASLPVVDPGTGERLVTAAAYLMLFLLGVAQGLVGTFFYSNGPVPLAAILFDLVLLLSCVLAAFGMRRGAGALAVAVGWLVATLVLAMGTKGGSVLITNTTAGKWFLFGGAGSAAAGVVAGFTRWYRRTG
jgi:hypothetical protein